MDNKYAFVALLPGENVSMAGLLSALDAKENQQLYQENDQLKKMLGDKELEIAMILKDLIKKKNPHLLTKLK